MHSSNATFPSDARSYNGQPTSSNPSQYPTGTMPTQGTPQRMHYEQLAGPFNPIPYKAPRTPSRGRKTRVVDGDRIEKQKSPSSKGKSPAKAAAAAKASSMAQHAQGTSRGLKGKAAPTGRTIQFSGPGSPFASPSGGFSSGSTAAGCIANPDDFAYLSVLPPRYYPALSESQVHLQHQAAQNQILKQTYRQGPAGSSIQQQCEQIPQSFDTSDRAVPDVDPIYGPPRNSKGKIELPKSYTLSDRKVAAVALMARYPGVGFHDFLSDDEDEGDDRIEVERWTVDGAVFTKKDSLVMQEDPMMEEGPDDPFWADGTESYVNLARQRKFSESTDLFIYGQWVSLNRSH